MNTFDQLNEIWMDFHRHCLMREQTDENQLKYAEMVFMSGMLSMLLNLDRLEDDQLRPYVRRMIAELEGRLVKEDRD